MSLMSEIPDWYLLVRLGLCEPGQHPSVTRGRSTEVLGSVESGDPRHESRLHEKPGALSQNER